MGLGDNISSDDLYRVSNSGNHPEYKESFENECLDNDDFGDAGDLFDSMFGFGSDDSSDSGSELEQMFLGGGDSTGGASGGGIESLNNNPYMNTAMGIGGNSPVVQGTTQAQPAKPNPVAEKLGEYSNTFFLSSIEVIKDLAKSVQNRTYSEVGYFGRNMIITGIVVAVMTAILGVAASIVGIKTLGFRGFATQGIIGGALMSSFGIIGISLSALLIETFKDRGSTSVNDIKNIGGDNNYADELSDEDSDEFISLFEDDDDDIEEDTHEYDEKANQADNLLDLLDIDIDNTKTDNNEYNPEDNLDNINENEVITRKRLVDTFLTMLPCVNAGFSNVTDIDENDRMGMTIKAACLKSAANVMKCEIEEINSDIAYIKETQFSYEIKMRRVKGLTKTELLEREIEAYFREDRNDKAVRAQVDIEGDYYRILVTKGYMPMVSFGDAFKLSYCREFFEDENNKLPVFLGIDETGNVIMADAKTMDTAIIAGKPRSGKSWYLLMWLMCLVTFNSPEDIQMLVIDPKETHLFKTFALLPHVFGLHGADNILEVLDDIIEIEAPRRKRLLDSNECDDIWALRKKGIRLSVLYIVLDEYMTISEKLGQTVKDLNSKLRVIISQLPSLGIRLLFVPHRVTGVVDKTNRTLVQFSASIRQNRTEVIDTLGIEKWSKPLVGVGDAAIKSSDMPDAIYVKALAVTENDEMNNKLIKTVAKAFYKMGAEFEDMSHLTVACNRNIDYIRSKLQDNGTEKAQFSEKNIFSGL